MAEKVPQVINISDFAQLRSQQMSERLETERKKTSKSVFGRAAEFIAPTTKGILTGEKKITPRTVLGAGLEVGSFLLPVGAIGRGLGLAGKGLINIAGEKAVQKAATTLGKRAIQGAKIGGATSATFEAGRALGEEQTTLGTIAGRIAKAGVLGTITGGAIPIATKGIGKLLTKSKEPLEAAGQILQSKAKEAKRGLEVFSQLNTKGVQTYADLSKRIGESSKVGLQRIDKALDKSIQRFKSNQIDRVFSSPEGRIRTNFVKNALNDLEELYTKTRSPADRLRIQNIRKTMNKIGLRAKDINDLAREYGTTFKEKAFGKLGDLRTSVNAVSFENTRKGLKDTARSFLPGTNLKNIDENISNMIRVQKLVDTMAEKVNALQQRVSKRNVVEKLSRGAGQIIDVATFGGPKAFITKLFFPSNVGQKTLNAIDLENRLSQNLKFIEEITKMPEEQMIRTLKEIAKMLSISRGVSIFGTEKEEDQ